MTFGALKTLAAKLSPRQRCLLACLCCLVLGGAGGAGSAWLHPRTVVVHDLQQTAHVASGVDLTLSQTHKQQPTVVVREKVVYREGPIRERIVTHVENGGSTTTTQEKQDVHTTSDTKTVDRSTTTVSPEGRWSFRVLAGADTHGGVVAGAAAEYRLLGPLTLGAWATGPIAGAPAPFTVGISAGLRLP